MTSAERDVAHEADEEGTHRRRWERLILNVHFLHPEDDSTVIITGTQ